jgi:hypothetical protein
VYTWYTSPARYERAFQLENVAGVGGRDGGGGQIFCTLNGAATHECMVDYKENEASKRCVTNGMTPYCKNARRQKE